jgi:hypothetical protein
MTNEQLKQEAIKNAYGEYWEQVKDFVDENGWCDYHEWFKFIGHKIDYIFSKDFRIRPKSLDGIENKFSFKKIKGFDFYEVNKLGVVRSLNRICIQKNGKKYPVKEKILVPQTDSHGYIVFCLKKNKISKKVYLHRILAECFIENNENKKCVNHKDGVKYNNSLDNLEWCTYKENNNHAFSTGLNITIGQRLLGKKGKDCHNTGKRNKKLSANGKIYKSVNEASLDLNITKGYLYQILCGSVRNNIKAYYITNQ